MDMAEQAERFLIEHYRFEDMHAQVGDRVQLGIPPASGERHYGILLGYLAGQSVLIKTPLVHGMPLPVADDARVTVRAFTGRGVFAFDSAVQRICVSPFHYLHLEFPAAVRGAQIRASERVRAHMPTEVTVQDGRSFPGLILDLGIGGALLECGERWPVGTPLQVFLRFELEPTNVSAGFKVATRIHSAAVAGERAAAAPLFRYGIAFESLTLGQTVMLQNFVYHRLLEDRQIAL